VIERAYGQTKALEKALDASWLRNEAISQNIANIDTPLYKKKTVAFEEYLNEALDGNGIEGIRTDKRHIPIGQKNLDEVDIKLSEDNSQTSMRIDGNNVDIDSEMAEMAKNTIKYNTLIQSLSTEFKRAKYVISEGKK
jgi:flagellar basal-body rod protein FlgB